MSLGRGYQKNNEVVFVFESEAEIENMRLFDLYYNNNLKLIRRDKDTGAFEAMNPQAQDIVSEQFLLETWKPDYIRSHNPVSSYIGILKKCEVLNIPHLYDQMDFWDGFPVQPWGECTEDDYIKYSNSAMTISNWLVKKNLEKTEKKFFMIPNAIKGEFEKKLKVSYDEVIQRQSNIRKTIVYSGAIWPEWFDWDIVSTLIKNRPEYDFLMIGAYNPSSDEDDGRNVREIVKELKNFDNVKFLGQISHVELIPYLKSSKLAYIESAYDMDKIKRINLNGDGAAWIKAGVGILPKTKFVLDKFHMHKYIITATSHLGDSAEDARSEIYRAIHKTGKRVCEDVFDQIIKVTDSETKRKAVETSKGYILSNWNGIQISMKGKDKNIKCSAEGHVSHVLSDRMSSRPLGWSRIGCDKMARLRVYQKNKGNMLELVRFQKRELQMAAGAEEIIYSASEMIAMENRNKKKLGNMADTPVYSIPYPQIKKIAALKNLREKSACIMEKGMVD